jgi:hypothetical protein
VLGLVLGIGCLRIGMRLVCGIAIYLFIYLFSHTQTEAFKAYAGQRKSKSRPRGLSHLSGPPYLLLPKNRQTKEERKKKKEKKKRTPRLLHPLGKESKWCLDGIRLDHILKTRVLK